jgi:hypothetical protein
LEELDAFIFKVILKLGAAVFLKIADTGLPNYMVSSLGIAVVTKNFTLATVSTSHHHRIVGLGVHKGSAIYLHRHVVRSREVLIDS